MLVHLGPLVGIQAAHLFQNRDIYAHLAHIMQLRGIADFVTKGLWHAIFLGQEIAVLINPDNVIAGAFIMNFRSPRQ